MKPKSCVYRKSRRPIPAKESHLLWAKSAGHCAYHSCTNRCVDSFKETGHVLLGEMAHLIAHSEGGPRASYAERSRLERYENLILLCPYHHTLVDKAPMDFPPEQLIKWKARLEWHVAEAFDVPEIKTKQDLYKYAYELLNANRLIHDNFGPSSVLARKTPLSNMHGFWDAKKTEHIIPNNTLIVAAFNRYRNLVPEDELATFRRFESHALAFAASAVDTLDSVPTFPVEFESMLDGREG